MSSLAENVGKIISAHPHWPKLNKRPGRLIEVITVYIFYNFESLNIESFIITRSTSLISLVCTKTCHHSIKGGFFKNIFLGPENASGVSRNGSIGLRLASVCYLARRGSLRFKRILARFSFEKCSPQMTDQFDLNLVQYAARGPAPER